MNFLCNSNLRNAVNYLRSKFYALVNQGFSQHSLDFFMFMNRYMLFHDAPKGYWWFICTKIEIRFHKCSLIDFLMQTVNPRDLSHTGYSM